MKLLSLGHVAQDAGKIYFCPNFATYQAVEQILYLGVKMYHTFLTLAMLSRT
jgi:hypothetical protein